MNKNSTMILGLFLLTFIAHLFLTLQGYNEMGVVTWVLLGFWLGSYSD